MIRISQAAHSDGNVKPEDKQSPTIDVDTVLQEASRGRGVVYPTLRAPARLAGLVVKASASGEEDPGFESRLRRDFSGSTHTSDLKIATPVATLPGSWHYRVSAGTGWPGVSIL